MRVMSSRVGRAQILAIITLCGGCAHKYVEKVGVFETSGDHHGAVASAPRSGMYHVQFVANDKYIKTPLYACDHWVMKGDLLGFREDENGKLVAIVGEDEV